jgi:osmotically-inducible protein OsmY
MTTGMSSGATQGGAGANNNTANGGFGQASGATGMQNLQRGGDTGFVGLSSATAQNPFSTGQGGRGNVNFNQLTQLMNQSRQNQFNRQQAQKSQRGNTQAKSQFRVPLRLGFQPSAPASGRVGAQITGQLNKVQGLSSVGPINVSLVGQTAVLRGTVASEADRQLAEGLVRLAPSVQGVLNELEVASPGTTAEGLPPGTGSGRGQ